MRFGACRSQLYDGQKTARSHWEETAELWTDSTRKNFGEKVWEPLDQMVTDLLRGVDQLTTLFAEIRDECEYRPE